MPLYAAIGFDPLPHAMPLRDKIRAAHRAYVLANDSSIRCAGAMRDADGNQCGTIYVFETPSEQKVWDWLKTEPFFAGGVYESMRVVLWSPTFNLLPPAAWPT